MAELGAVKEKISLGVDLVVCLWGGPKYFEKNFGWYEVPGGLIKKSHFKDGSCKLVYSETYPESYGTQTKASRSLPHSFSLS